MKVIIELEVIGNDYLHYLHCERIGKLKIKHPLFEERYRRIMGWFPEWPSVTLLNKDGTETRLRGTNDYSRANSTGSRGVYKYFILDDGYYRVFDRTNWKKTRTYYVRVAGCDIVEVSIEEIEKWRQNDT